jgi:hypothetical protein
MRQVALNSSIHAFRTFLTQTKQPPALWPSMIEARTRLRNRQLAKSSDARKKNRAQAMQTNLNKANHTLKQQAAALRRSQVLLNSSQETIQRLLAIYSLKSRTDTTLSYP